MSTTTINRNEYGAIPHREVPSLPGKPLGILADAIKAGKLDSEYINFDRKGRGKCLNYDVYDVLGGTVLVQRRETEKTKYGTNPQKSYYLLRRAGRGVSVTEANKAIACKAAKSSERLGDAIRVLQGKAKMRSKSAEKQIVFKAAAVLNGEYRSIYKNSVRYEIGRTLTQKAQGDHEGGFYAYRTAEEAQKAEVPSDSDNIDAPRVVLRCEAWGRSIGYGNGKVAFTNIKPVGVVG